MKAIKIKYRAAKQKAINYMKKGQLNAYFEALEEMRCFNKQLVILRAK